MLVCADFLRPKYMEFHIGNEGREMRVLMDNLKDGSYFAYTDNYLKVRVPVNPLGLENRMAKVRIGQAFPEYCLAELFDWESS